MNLATLYKETARVIDLMADVPNWYTAIRCSGRALLSPPRWNSPPESYTFAIGVRHNKPVFEGDVMYGMFSGHEYILTSANIHHSILLQWDKPDFDKTVIVNGMKYEVPATDQLADSRFTMNFDGFTYWFKTKDARDDVIRMFSSVLDGSIKQ